MDGLEMTRKLAKVPEGKQIHDDEPMGYIYTQYDCPVAESRARSKAMPAVIWSSVIFGDSSKDT
jgi:hypothetical protein